jgi:hypothetical protein
MFSVSTDNYIGLTLHKSDSPRSTIFTKSEHLKVNYYNNNDGGDDDDDDDDDDHYD